MLLSRRSEIEDTRSRAARPALQIREVDRIEQLPAAALRLLEDRESLSIQLGPDWLSLLQQHAFGPRERIRHVAVMSDEGCQLVHSFRIRRGTLGHRIEPLANFYTALQMPAVGRTAPVESVATLLQHMSDHHGPLESVEFHPLPDDACTRIVEQALQSLGWDFSRSVCFTNHVLSWSGGWSAYLASRSANLRSTIRRCTRRLEAAGGTIRIVDDPAEVDRAMEDYEQVYAHSWKQSEPFPAFWREFARTASRKGWLRLGVACLGQEPIAAQFWTVHAGQVEIHKLAYAIHHKSMGSGTALTAALMQRVMDVDGARTVDFLTGDDEYKSRWMSHQRERLRITAHPSTHVSGRLSGWMQRSKQFIRSRVFHPAPPPRAGGRDAALVIGLDTHGLAEVRALAAQGITVFGVEHNLSQPGCRSPQLARVFPVADMNGPDLVDDLQRIRRQLAGHRRVVLIPTNDTQTAHLCRRIEVVRDHFHVPWADCAQTVLRLLRKDELESICNRQGLLYPRSVVFESDRDAPRADSLRFPVIIKPVKPLSSFKTLMAHSPGELQAHLSAHSHDLPILGQEYIEGDDTAIHFGALLLNKGRVMAAMSGRKIESFPKARGQTTIAQTHHDAEVIRLSERFFEGLRLSGPASLELKKDPQGRYWVIEPTVGRTDFWLGLCTASGLNLSAMGYAVALGQEVQAPQALQGAVWYDTERDPTAYLRLCWQYRSWAPVHPRQHFPFAGSGLRVRTSALSHQLRRILNRR